MADVEHSGQLDHDGPSGNGFASLNQQRGPSLVSSKVASKLNLAKVLQTLYAGGPLSRAELARRLGTNRASIGQIVGPLLEQEVLVEGEPLEVGASGGKRPRPLWFAPGAWPVAALHLLPGRVEAAVLGAGGAVLVQATPLTYDAYAAGQPEVLSLCGSVLREVLAAAALEVGGIGVAVSGMVDAEAGCVVDVTLAPVLKGLPIGPALEREFGVPVIVDLHPRAQALGDLWFGAGRGINSYVSLYTGDTLGAGFVIAGRLHRGTGGAGGEVGHTTIVAEGGMECRCGRHGCWETIATDRWLRDEAKLLKLPTADTMTVESLKGLVPASTNAAELMARYAHNLALGVANLHQILAPDLFILHGGAVAGGEELRAQVEELAATMTPEHPAARPRVVLTQPDIDSPLRGAACLVLASALHLRP